MKPLTEPARIAWALIWRATLLAPALWIFSVFHISCLIGTFALPVLALLSIWARDGMLVAIYGTAWILCLSLWKWKRFRNVWEDPSSML